ncbi:MAG: ArsR family transcriptional regulator [Armatimonadota bacterium]|nr:ArsR family transcriptional regulator [Armatimonadota bacterium]
MSARAEEVTTRIGSALFGATRRRVLGLLFRESERDFYQREIVEAVGCGSGAVQRELKQLAGAGLITREARGRMVFYQANRQCPVFEELRGLVMKTSGLADVLRQALQPDADRIRVAFIFGSMADGTDDALSDVDVMIIGELTRWDRAGSWVDAQSALNREINSVIWSEQQFRQKLAAGEHFVTAVMRGPKVFLIGDEHELRRVAASEAPAPT